MSHLSATPKTENMNCSGSSRLPERQCRLPGLSNNCWLDKSYHCRIGGNLIQRHTVLWIICVQIIVQCKQLSDIMITNTTGVIIGKGPFQGFSAATNNHDSLAQVCSFLAVSTCSPPMCLEKWRRSSHSSHLSSFCIRLQNRRLRSWSYRQKARLLVLSPILPTAAARRVLEEVSFGIARHNVNLEARARFAVSVSKSVAVQCEQKEKVSAVTSRTAADFFCNESFSSFRLTWCYSCGPNARPF